MPPQNILNAPTRLMKDIGYGKGYAYDHDTDTAFSGDNYWPEEMTPQTFYAPTDRGFEKRIRRAVGLLGPAEKARWLRVTSWDEVVAFALPCPRPILAGAPMALPRSR